MKILIVDDDRINSTILTRLLSRDGHDVITATNGGDGVETYAREHPDLVLMDVRMPVMNGYEAARRIKSMATDQFVPIIFLTAITDEEGLAQCIDAGGDDFLTKPFNRTILGAKIGAMARIRDLDTRLRQQTWVLEAQKQQLQEQKWQLELHQESVQQELEVGNHLFSNIVRAGNLLDAPCLNHWTAPMSLFNGDLLVASYNPTGGLNIMLGDFTGHGLSAAVGALPLAETFYGMTAQGISIGELVEEINAKLMDVMPTRMFCAACLMEVDPRQKSITVWNGGLPDVFIVDGQGDLVMSIPSTHLPLGVVPTTREERKVEIIEMQDDYRIFLHSDGLTEATDDLEEMYGTERLLESVKRTDLPEQIFDTILEDLGKFRGGAKQSDDISLLEVVCSRAGEAPPGGRRQNSRKDIPPSAWQIDMSFSAATLKAVDPLPTLINAVMNLQAPAGHREKIYTILAELFSNALDHGLLRLETDMKKSPEGFAQYYIQREKRLMALEEGEIRCTLTHSPLSYAAEESADEQGEERGVGGEIHIQVEDSGPGFDPLNVHSNLESNFGHGGRGIALVRSLCSRLVYRGCGNVAEAIYQWRSQ
ncbi:MAG: fused response regulator/phosphatase [Magnetococcales bacterium]|nr:fused response regulator/phosphatase [Magnetococcales bacterium]